MEHFNSSRKPTKCIRGKRVNRDGHLRIDLPQKLGSVFGKDVAAGVRNNEPVVNRFNAALEALPLRPFQSRATKWTVGMHWW